ncbi:MAG TPA: hypothetical protein VLL52_21025, partial [Anaerolineae bacterium]|nr:hypothetical protein [Anaerolineae bacterium]
LDSYTIDTTPITPGTPFTVTLCWRATGTTTTSYTRFLHLLGPDGRLLIQNDAIPQQATRPTTSWYQETITETITLTPPSDLPPGPYQLITGFYNPQTNTRLTHPTTNQQFIILPTP